MKQQVHVLYLFNYFRTKHRIRTVGITSWRIRRHSQPAVRNHCSILTHKILTVLNSVNHIHRHLIEIYHISYDMIRYRLFLEKETTRRHSVFQWDGFNRQRTVIVYHSPLCRIDVMEYNLKG